MVRIFQSFSVSADERRWGLLFENYLKIILIWCPVVTVLFVVGFSGMDQFWYQSLISWIISMTVASFCFGGSVLVTTLWNQLHTKWGQRALPQTPLFGIALSLPFMFPGMYFGFRLAGLVSATMGYRRFESEWKDYTSGVIFGILVGSLFALFEVIRESKQAKQAAENRLRNLENEKLKAQVSALSAQMNPHLLFNSLNTIASTIGSDPQSAEDMVVQLSELYRGILKSAKEDMHSLESELMLCRSYLEIEQRRFGDRIRFQIQTHESLDPRQIQLPVLLIQPLVENAVKHGLAPTRKGGRVLIEICREEAHLMIRVIDDGAGIDPLRPSNGTKTGLANCASRLQLKYGKNSDFHFGMTVNGETEVRLRLPIEAVNLAGGL